MSFLISEQYKVLCTFHTSVYFYRYQPFHIFIFEHIFYVIEMMTPEVSYNHLNLSDIEHRLYPEHVKIAIISTVSDKTANNRKKTMKSNLVFNKILRIFG